mmetsp:Transcript_19536/g.53503  ORF Transcript_19536/g.53503 Transcript_19536/m.53503 type:complete len:226 (-) Transcript_19536:489-1166(-)
MWIPRHACWKRQIRAAARFTKWTAPTAGWFFRNRPMAPRPRRQPIRRRTPARLRRQSSRIWKHQCSTSSRVAARWWTQISPGNCQAAAPVTRRRSTSRRRSAARTPSQFGFRSGTLPSLGAYVPEGTTNAGHGRRAAFSASAPTRWLTSMRGTACIATSSPRTSSSRATVACDLGTSAWRRWSTSLAPWRMGLWLAMATACCRRVRSRRSTRLEPAPRDTPAPSS